ncbi:hypothetical protein Dimus_023759 [Dionaea muscipula]
MMNSSLIPMRTSAQSSSSPRLSIPSNPNPNRARFNHRNKRCRVSFFLTRSTKSIQSSSSSVPSFTCPAAVASLSPSGTSDVAASRLRRLVNEFECLVSPVDKVKRLLEYAMMLPQLDEPSRTAMNRVMGCTAQVWLEVRMDDGGRMRFGADSDSEITRGFCACLVSVLDGAAPEEVLELKAEELAAVSLGSIGVGGGLGIAKSRGNTWYNVLITMQKRTRTLVAEREGKPVGEKFPSLVIGRDEIVAKGSYAQAQARYMFPDELAVSQLVKVLREKKIGIVAR